MGEKAV
jgi:hypothetical protein